MRTFKRFLKLLPVLVLVLALLTTAALATEETFDTENFVGLVLQNNAPDTVTVNFYTGFSTASTKLMTPDHTETIDGVQYSYYTVTAGSKYTCTAKPTSGYGRYNDLHHIYITEEEAAVKTVLDVTPEVRSTNGWDPSGQIRHYTDETLTNIFPSDPSLWPQYADFFTTPGFGDRGTAHKQTTQDELEAFIAGLNGDDDNMYVYILGQSGGTAFDIPLVIFTETDLSGADTLEEAAALVNANGKLTVHYQAQIHGNEPAAGEAALGMIQRLDGDYGAGLLDSMNIYVIPRLSPYGAYKSQRAVYLTSTTTTDPNRDFLRLWTKETTLRMEAYNLFDPEVVFDGHEFQVSASTAQSKKRDMMMCTHFLPTHMEEYQDVAIALAFAGFDQLKADGLGYSWYTDSVNGIGANTGSSNTAYRASLHILMETDGIYRGLQNYERRVAAHASAMTGMFAYLDANAETVKAVVQAQRDTIVENGKTYKEEDIVILDGSSLIAEDTYSNWEELEIQGQWVNLDSGTVYSNSTFPAHVTDVIKRSRIAPTAYVIPAGETYTQKVLDRMDKQGISYDFIPAGSSINLQQYTVAALRDTGTCSEAGLTAEQAVTFPNGAYAFTMDQVDGYILAFLMEPDVNDAWNSDLEKYQGTFVYDNVIPTPAEVGGTFPIYRYIRDLNTEGQIDYMFLPDAPEGLQAVGATKIGGTGSITGLDATKAYEYRAESETEYTAVEIGATEITGLAVGRYYVRFAATDNSEASADAAVEVGYGVLDEYAVYLDSTNGADTNDGYTEAAPVATIDKAYSQLTALMESAPAGTTGKLVIIGTYTQDGERILPSHEYPLLITGGKFIFKETSPAGDYRYLGMGGDTTFDDVTISVGSGSSYYYLYAMGHKLVMGDGVVCEPYVSTSGSKYYFNISGGKNGGGTVEKTDLTVLTGYWNSIYAGDYTGKVTNGVKAVVENCSISRVVPSYSGTTTGEVYMSLENVTVRTELYCGNTLKGNVNGNVTLVLGEGVTSPKIYAGSRNAGNVTGTVTVIADGIDLTANTIHGKANNDTGTIGGLKLVLNQGQLINVADTFVTMDGTEIVLGCDQTEAVTLDYSCNLDLGGCDATITVADGKTLTVCDTATDDFKVLDEQGYGILTATGTTAAKEGYVVREETNGKSYHRRELKLDSIVLRPVAAGIYYTGQFGLNELYRDNVESYGVVLSLNPEPELGKEGCKHSTLTQWPESGAGYGTVLQNIMTKDGGYTSNKANANMTVYGVAYVKYTDGTVEYSNSAQYTLKQVVEASDTMWAKLDEDQKNGLLAMYQDFSNVMKAWTIPNIKAAA